MPNARFLKNVADIAGKRTPNLRGNPAKALDRLLDAMKTVKDGPVDPHTLTRASTIKDQLAFAAKQTPKPNNPASYLPPSKDMLPATVPTADAKGLSMLQKLLIGGGAAGAAGAGGAGLYALSGSGAAAAPAIAPAVAAAAPAAAKAAPGLLETLKNYGGIAAQWAQNNPGYAAAGAGIPLDALAAYYATRDNEEKAASVAFNLGQVLARG